MSIGTMPPGSVVVHLNILKDSLAHVFPCVESFPWISSTFMEWKKLSAQALSKGLPLALMEQISSCFLIRVWYFLEQYWLPRSECTITLLGIRLRHSAICRASQTSPAFMRLSMAQPITMRENRSRTTARYSQPSPVHSGVRNRA